MKRRIARIVIPAIITVACEHSFYTNPTFAITYLSVEQAQQTLAPQVSWKNLDIILTEEQSKQIEEISGSKVLSAELKVWGSKDGDYFIVDNVEGKHDLITYAVLLNSSGILKGIEILDYRETYGDQIRRSEWRAQFVGKAPSDQLEFTKDILNISGATISCSHVTKGVKRLFATYDLVLKKHTFS